MVLDFTELVILDGLLKEKRMPVTKFLFLGNYSSKKCRGLLE
jgi:hypothetical protein